MTLPREVELVLDNCVQTMLTEWKEFRTRPGFSIDEPISNKPIVPADDTQTMLQHYLAQTPASAVLAILDAKAKAVKLKRGTPRPVIVSGEFCVDNSPPLSVAIMVTASMSRDVVHFGVRLRLSPDSLVYLLSPTGFGRAQVSASAMRVWVVDEQTLVRRTAQRFEAEKIVRKHWPRLTGNEVQEQLHDMVVLRGLAQPRTTAAFKRDDALAHLRSRNRPGVTSFVAAAIAMGLPLESLLEDP